MRCDSVVVISNSSVSVKHVHGISMQSSVLVCKAYVQIETQGTGVAVRGLLQIMLKKCLFCPSLNAFRNNKHTVTDPLRAG